MIAPGSCGIRFGAGEDAGAGERQARNRTEEALRCLRRGGLLNQWRDRRRAGISVTALDFL
jgi:hypothetical protein